MTTEQANQLKYIYDNINSVSIDNKSKKLRSFTLTGRAMGGGNFVGGSTTIYCLYDDNGNFTGFSPSSVSWNGSAGTNNSYGAGSASLGSLTIN